MLNIMATITLYILKNLIYDHIRNRYSSTQNRLNNITDKS